MIELFLYYLELIFTVYLIYYGYSKSVLNWNTLIGLIFYGWAVLNIMNTTTTILTLQGY